MLNSILANLLPALIFIGAAIWFSWWASPDQPDEPNEHD